ncbi:DUF2975 domain-containing protein [uncultured Winogradskyella sp.]|tara:strand:- start:972 stop:1466 length:495 start_codon:yes stop_codon:yes gene_type:complete
MKILKLGISTLFVLLSIAVLVNIVFLSSAFFFGKDLFYQSYSNLELIPTSVKVFLALKISALLIFVYAVFLFIKEIKLFSNGQFFNSKLIKCFSRSGSLFFISGLLGFITSFSIFFIDIRYFAYFQIDSRSLYVMLMIIGLFLIMFRRVLEKGTRIQQENDLTI